MDDTVSVHPMKGAAFLYLQSEMDQQDRLLMCLLSSILASQSTIRTMCCQWPGTSQAKPQPQHRRSLNALLEAARDAKASIGCTFCGTHATSTQQSKREKNQVFGHYILDMPVHQRRKMGLIYSSPLLVGIRSTYSLLHWVKSLTVDGSRSQQTSSSLADLRHLNSLTYPPSS